MKYIYLLVIILFSIFNTSAAQDLKKRAAKSAMVKDTTQKIQEPIDTVKINPLKSHGSLLFNSNSNINISKKETDYIRYNTFAEIFKDKLDVFPFFLGTNGDNNNISYMGANPNAINYLFNGRRLNDINYGSYDLNGISPEFIENTEVLTGSDAAVLTGSAGIGFNFQERRFNTAAPYTRLWYSQSAYGYLGADGIFSQNFHKKWNLTFGFKSTGADGRFTNQSFESWNVRSVLRWNPNDNTSISFSDNYSDMRRGTNGGLNPGEGGIYDAIASVPYFNDLDERDYKHDLTLSFTHENELFKKLAINAYTTSVNHLRNYAGEDNLLAIDSTLHEKYVSLISGANVKTELNYAGLDLSFGGDIFYFDAPGTFHTQSSNGTGFNSYARIKYLLPGNISISGGARTELIYDKGLFSTGARISFPVLSDSLRFTGDLSRTEINPSPAQGLSLGKEQHLLGTVGIEYTNADNFASTQLFYRRIDDPILSQLKPDGQGIVRREECPCNKKEIFGALIRFNTRIMGIFLNNSVQVYYTALDGKNDMTLPNLYWKSKAYYNYRAGNSLLSAGAEFSFMSRFKGSQYYPITREYTITNAVQDWSNNGVNAFVTAKLGNAFLRIALENILSYSYYYVPYYPVSDMTFNLTLSWSFND